MAKRYHSSITGRFVSEAYAKKHPQTTYGSPVKPRKRRKKKKC